MVFSFNNKKISDSEAYVMLKKDEKVNYHITDVKCHSWYLDGNKIHQHGCHTFYKFPDIVIFYWKSEKLK